MPNNLFLLTDKTEKAVKRIPLTADLQKQLKQVFDEQSANFFPKDHEEIAFDGRMHPEEDTVFVISDFALPDGISRALKNPISSDIFKFSFSQFEGIQSLFAPLRDGAVGFQTFDRRQLISTRMFSIVSVNDTFKRLEEPGLTLASQLSVIYQNGNLYFRSFSNARRIFDLTAFYREATDNDLKKLAGLNSVIIDSANLADLADNRIRRKVALVLDSGVLEKETPRKIQKEAKDYGISVAVKKVDGKERVEFPSAKKELKDFLAFLDEDYYTSPFGNRWRSNSKRKLASSKS